jgi:2-polyprenyl-3-methyl-5-hydroxy-6-metoxy-1,4-benzoquinol methylase
MASITRRRIERELMDDPDVDRAELDRALRFLRGLNRRFGGVGALLRELERWAPAWPEQGPVRLLDVGTGSADIPRAVTRWARARGRRVHVTAVDAHPTTIDLARAHVGDDPDVELLLSDARALTDHFEPGAFDYVHASLFLHHLDDLDAMTVLRIMDRLAAHAVIVNDLVRDRLSAVCTRVATLAAGPMVRHDAIASVRAGFTRAEILDLARRVGLHRPRYRRCHLYRFTVTSEKS